MRIQYILVFPHHNPTNKKRERKIMWRVGETQSGRAADRECTDPREYLCEKVSKSRNLFLSRTTEMCGQNNN